MARKKNVPEEEIVNATCEEAVPAEETLEDTTPPDVTGADTGSFSADLPDTVLPAEESAEMSETLPTVDETAEEIIKDYPTADEEDIGMILDELLMTVFDEGAPDNEDDLMTVRFSDTQIDRLYSQGCKHNEMLPYQINAWQEKIKDVFLFYVAETSYSVFDVCYHFLIAG